jgi:hypothetical protein
VVIECITDPDEPPMPPKATKAEMKHLTEALTRGERDRGRISLTIARQAMDEALFPASDYGGLARVKDNLFGGKKEDKKRFRRTRISRANRRMSSQARCAAALRGRSGSTTARARSMLRICLCTGSRPSAW